MLGKRHGQSPPWVALVIGAAFHIEKRGKLGALQPAQGLSRVRFPWDEAKDRSPPKKNT